MFYSNEVGGTNEEVAKGRRRARQETMSTNGVDIKVNSTANECKSKCAAQERWLFVTVWPR